VNAISIKNLTSFYDEQKILEDINLEVYERDFLAIIGPNGGGKSTLLKSILGIITPKNGSIKIFGKSNLKTLEQIGYVPQNTNINIDFPIRVIDVVMMGHVDACSHQTPKGFKKFFWFSRKSHEVTCALGSLKEVGMDKFAYTKIASLSGGQRQRVMIARALCSNPKILLLDEPTSNIDAEGQRSIYDFLKKLNEHITIVVVSHDISVILEYANKVVYINKKLVFHEIPKNIDSVQKHDGHFCEVELMQMLGGLK
jgi:zinc transport system ATP-binding protein